ncbi:MAG: Structural maintenance of chromosomes protein 3 [Cirrosporium novae-zelandiae]|nr:MAG: Structural maintenance of chromosomes protein 3 [Cirrosporium novae-zelandiae]
MYIKQIIIQGFKSYKDQTVIEPFSPQNNVIVGRNGSGKSNFFAAIRFVLSDAYTQMNREERQGLLHEGSGSAVMSAYVEIIFDNSDERFPTGRDEVVLRRTIGLKKDEYSLDRKNATKADVMNLLESAGFSRSNPYYIVPQGRVTTLTNMKDTERLNLLKEVAGTQVYEARRAESLKIMGDTSNKRAKIDELLAYINERLGELEEEKDELRTYQEKDRERRCLEYTIYVREQEEIQRALDELDEKRQTGVDDTDDNRDQFIQNEKEMARINGEISELKQQMEFLKVDKAQLEDERKENARAKAKAELQLNNLREGQSAADQKKVQRDQELENVQNLIQQREAELAQILPQFQARKEEEESVKAQLDEAETTRQRLYAKQGRNSRFRNKAERDGWLRQEIDNTYESVAKVRANRMQTTDDITELEKEKTDREGEIQQLRAQLDSRTETLQSLDTQVQSAKDERDRLMDQRKELWREDAKLDSVIANAQQELDKADRALSHMMDQNTSRGLAAVRRIKQRYNMEGVYGTLAELVEVHERFRIAVEVTAGNSLFHYVVDNDDTATKVLEILQKEKAGRITFMPLNRLRPRPQDLPKAGDALPMIEKLQYDVKYDKAFQQVFGKTIICPNLSVCSTYARSHGVNAITPDGDRSDKKGALTGGFHDPRSSRLEGVRNVSKWREEYESLRNRSIELRRSLERMDQEITRAVGELQKLEQKRQQIQNSYLPLRQELKAKVDALHTKEDALEAKHRALANIDSNLRALSEQQNAHEEELSTSFKKALSNEEEAQLESLSVAVQDLRRQYTTISSTRSDLETQKSVLEVELRENLQPRLEALTTAEEDGGADDDDPTSPTSSRTSVRDAERLLKRLTKSLNTTESKLSDLTAQIESQITQVHDLESQISNLRTGQENLAKQISRHQRLLEKSTQKRAVLAASAATCAANIRALGVLPEEAFTRFTSASSNTLVKRLHAVSAALKKYGSVNKKAFEQYQNFTRQRETLMGRREELDKSQDSIRELISVLDQRKDEAIERTFKQVSKEFSRIFQRLVPQGSGRLVIQRKIDKDRAAAAGEEESDDEEGNKSSVDNYIGIGISVSFSPTSAPLRIQALSGGQKSLCALTLIFSIQACDPAPFYLFDEIDAALDSQYRQAVADLLAEISEKGDASGQKSQFICTTFRPEMVRSAGKCYGVVYAGKASKVERVSMEEALGFVEGVARG